MCVCASVCVCVCLIDSIYSYRTQSLTLDTLKDSHNDGFVHYKRQERVDNKTFEIIHLFMNYTKASQSSQITSVSVHACAIFYTWNAIIE